MKSKLLALTLMLSASTSFAYTKRPFIIAVAGGSASGKTYNARMIVEALGHDRAVLISADNYYAPEKQTPEFYLNGSINYDHPSAVDLKKLAWHLSYLRSGFPVQVKEYTYGRAVAVDNWITHEAKEFIVVEGIFALYAEIADLVDYRVFVDVNKDLRFARRLARDQKERGLSEAEVRDYFERVVEPMHVRYIQPSALRADQIIESPNDPEQVAKIVRQVQEQAHKMREVKSTVMLETYDRALDELLRTHEGQFGVASIDELYPSQPDLGFLALSNKSFLIDSLVRETALNADQPSSLAAYLKANPVPVIEMDGKTVVTDHHHLIMALYNKGIRRFLTVPADINTVAPERLDWIRAQNKMLTFAELRNNPYRSLASLIRDLGYVLKTGKPHEEFEWANYYRSRLEGEYGIQVSEEKLLDVDERTVIVNLAIQMAKDERARALPGYIEQSPCERVLDGP